MRSSLFLILALVAHPAFALTINFNDLTLAPSSFVNGPMPNATTEAGPFGSQEVGSFTSGGAQFGNVYDDTFGSWRGFAYSNMTDTKTPGYTNQYSAFTSADNVAESRVYAVASGYLDQNANEVQPFPFDPNDPAQLAQLPSVALPAGYVVQSVAVTNTTYAALSILQGDSFAKRFGGLSGNDPDFFKLSVYGTDIAGHTLTNHVDFYLADYRFADSSFDYIVNTWQSVDLAPLGAATHLYFNLASSDLGGFGMNTPASFALGDIQLAAVPEPSTFVIAVTAAICAATGKLRRRRIVS